MAGRFIPQKPDVVSVDRTPVTAEILRWILGGVILLFGAHVVFCNWACFVLNARNRRNGVDRNYSQGPLVGAICILLGLSLLPVSKPVWLWAAALLDPSVWLLALLVPLAIGENVAHRSRRSR